jgi:Na+/H+ antiporter NhaD/arsenite permease-like protein
VKIPGVPSVRLTLGSSLYVGAVALIAAVGFAEQSAWPILFAAVLAVPASIVAVPCYYLVYGFLALIPGANPSSNSGSSTSAADGRTLTSVSTGMPAAWFTITTFVLGILCLTVAAFVNVLLLRALAARRRSNEPVKTQSSPNGE